MTEHSHRDNDVIVETFAVGPLQCNCTIVGDRQSKQAIVVDPGGDAEKILAIIEQHQLRVVQIIHTHAHLDHILAAGVIKQKTGAPIYLHKADKFLWDMLDQQCARFGLPSVVLPEPDHWLHDDAALSCCDGTVVHTPGHTPGSTSFWFEHLKLLIAGDTLFRHSVGRTDFTGGDFPTIQKSIKERLYVLDDEATVITGHGPATSIGEEKQENPFVRP